MAIAIDSKTRKIGQLSLNICSDDDLNAKLGTFLHACEARGSTDVNARTYSHIADVIDTIKGAASLVVEAIYPSEDGITPQERDRAILSAQRRLKFGSDELNKGILTLNEQAKIHWEGQDRAVRAKASQIDASPLSILLGRTRDFVSYASQEKRLSR